MPRWSRFRDLGVRLRRATEGEEGAAALEFLALGVVLLVPLAYLVLALGQIQAQTLGVEAGARFAARALAAGQQDAPAILDSVATQYGIDDYEADVRCVPASGRCPEPGATLQVTVRAHVPLPLIPPVLGLDQIAAVPVEAVAVHKVSRYGEAR